MSDVEEESSPLNANYNDTISAPSTTIERKRKKSVRFTSDTIVTRENNVALSITRHVYAKELGYTQYHVQILYKGIQWTVFKRYRDFEEFNRHLQAVYFGFVDLPPLPKKRWFEKQRWLNRFDESYSLNRRIALQDYMRDVARIPQVRDHFKLFREFLCFPAEALQAFEREMELGDLEEHKYIFYEQDGNGQLAITTIPTSHTMGETAESSPSNDESVQLSPSANDQDIDSDDEEGYVEDDELDNHDFEAERKHSGVHFKYSRDSILETKLCLQFDDDGNIIPENTFQSTVEQVSY